MRLYALSDTSSPTIECDNAGTATVEDGEIARMALAGEYVPWDVEEYDMFVVPPNTRI